MTDPRPWATPEAVHDTRLPGGMPVPAPARADARGAAERARAPVAAPTDAAAVAGGANGAAALAPLLGVAVGALARGCGARGGPLPAGGPAAVADAVRAALGTVGGTGGVLPAAGVGAAEALTALVEMLARGSADPSDAACAGHLHTPPLAVAVAAELAVAALNQSLDSWDQAPAAVTVEREVVAALGALAGYADADGVMTSGGTESNLMGLMLARDAALRRRFGVQSSATGIPAAASGRLRVLCSAAAHFSVARSAALLGLGESAIVPVGVDTRQRMDPAELRRALARVAAHGETPIAIVATAGTTDTGAVDPLPDVVAAARTADVPLHVDAAYGGGALFSERLAPLLDGLAGADSIALDLHKLGWQPAPAGVFLVRDRAALAPLRRTVSYLNPADDEAAGLTAQLGRSLRTTRRADAFPVAVALRALGRDGLGRLVERCHDLAAHAAAAVRAHPRLELAVAPQLTIVVFRFAARRRARSAVNAALRRRLLHDGTAVVGRAQLAGSDETWLKLTLLHPHAKPADVDRVLALVVAAGETEDDG